MKIICTIMFHLLLASLLQGANVDTLRVFSTAMNKSVSNVVILPDGYSEGQTSYPVLYLLHGAGDDFSKWVTTVPDIKTYADQYDVVIVCPDGGRTSWYFDSPIDDSMQYETYISKELISAVDQHYRTVSDRAHRAITGLSMGGHGAFYLAFKHQEIWGAAGSMSGGVDIRPFPGNWDLPERLGAYADFPEHWESNTVINLIKLLKKDSLKLIFDCGYDDFFFAVNQRLHEELLYRNIPHDFIERPGNHSWTYWTNAIKYQFLFFSDYFKGE